MKTDLIVKEVTRDYNEKKFTCQAENNNQQEPLKRTITIKMNCKYSMFYYLIFLTSAEASKSR